MSGLRYFTRPYWRWTFWEWRWKRRLLRWTACRIRGHRLGQIEPGCLPGRRKGERGGSFAYSRPCKRCGVEVACNYANDVGIYEYEAGHKIERETVVRNMADVYKQTPGPRSGETTPGQSRAGAEQENRA